MNILVMSLNICGHGRRNFEKAGGMARLGSFEHNNVQKFWINHKMDHYLIGNFQKYVQKIQKIE